MNIENLTNKLNKMDVGEYQYLTTQIIRGEHLKPYKRFGTGNMFGCELKVAFSNRATALGCSVALRYIKGIQLQHNPHIGTYGFEIITDQMNFQMQVFMWRTLLPILQSFSAKCTEDTEFHVHLDKTKNVLFNVKCLFNSKCTSKLNAVAMRDIEKFYYINGNFDSKQCAVFVSPTKGVEIRIFKCSLILKDILKFLIFCNDIYEMDSVELLHKYC
jgi:hypothetical protein